MFLGASLATKAQSWVWARQGSGPNDQWGRAVAVDPVSGAVFVAGEYDGTITQYGLTAGGNHDIILARYYPDGTLHWAISMGGNVNDGAFGLACDSAGAVYMSGYFQQSVDFGGNGAPILLPSTGSTDGFLAKFDSLGRGRWAKRCGGTGSETSYAVAVHGGSVYFTGDFNNSISFSGTATTLTSSGAFDAFVARYDTAGNFHWAQSWGSNAFDRGLGLAADGAGVYCTGTYNGINASFSTGGPAIVLPNAFFGTTDIALARMRKSDGKAVWAIGLGGNANDVCHDLAVVGERLFLAGEFAGTATFGSLGSAVSAGNTDLFVAALDTSAGAGLWLHTAGSAAGNERARGVDARAGLVWVSGDYDDAFTWSGNPLPLIGDQGGFASAFNSGGVHLWAGYLGSSESDNAPAIALGDGCVYLAGTYGDTPCNFFPSAGLSITGTSDDDLYLGKIEFVNPPPTAVADTFSIYRDSTTQLPVLANDLIPYGSTAMVSVVCPASNGSATTNGSQVQYVPNPGYIGLDSFCYSICILGPVCDTAWVHLNVLAPLTVVNPPPTPSLLTTGSLVIPMDSVLQMDGGGLFNLYAYGLANALLQANIPLKWCIRSGKFRDEIDFSAMAERVAPTAISTANRDFIGGPLAIDSAYHDSALVVITTYNASVPQPVSVYRLSQDVTVDVRYLLTHKPKIAVFINGGNQAIHTDFLLTAGIPPIYFDTIQPSAAVFDSTACYTFASNASWSGASLADTVDTRLVRQFLLYGGNFLAQNEAIGVYEALEGFQTSAGLNGGPQGTEAYLNEDMPFLQVHGPVEDGGGTFAAYAPRWGGDFLPGTYAVIQRPSLACFKATARKIGLAAKGGINFYLGGETYGVTDNRNRNARRMYLDGILVPARRPAACRLDFATDIEVKKTVSPGIYCVGDTVTYLIVVNNRGPGEAIDVEVRDTLGAGLAFVSASASQGSYNPTSQLWTVGNVDYLLNDSLWIRAVVTATGPIKNTAWVSASIYSPDLNALNDSSSVIFNSLFRPNATILPMPPLCDNGAPVALTAGSPGGSWSGVGVSGTSFDPTLAGPGIFTVHYSVTAGLCSDQDSIPVTVNAAPVFSLGPDSALCQGDSMVLDPNLVVTSYAWSNAASSPTIAVTSSGSYALTVTDTNACSAADTINVIFNALPVFSLGPDSVLCQGDSLVLDPLLAATAYAWNTSATSPSITVSNTGTFSVTLTDANNCSAADTASVTFELPPQPMLGGPYFLCDGDTHVLDAGVSSTTYAWSTGANTPSISVAISGSYSVTVSSAIGCAGSDSTQVNVWPVPVVDATGNPSGICLNAGAILLVATPAGGTFSGPGIAGSSLVPGMAGAGTHDLLYQYVDSNGCSDSDTFSVVIHDLPVVMLGGLEAEYCENQPDDSLQMMPVGGALSGPGLNGNAFSPSGIGPGGPYLLNYAFTDSNGCEAEATLSTLVFGLPTQADAGPDQVLQGVNHTNLQGNVPLIGLGSWTLLSGWGSISSGNDPSATVSDLGTGENLLAWTIGSAVCGSTSDTVRIIRNELLVPTGFSPNGDQVNDFFVIRGIENYDSRSLRVFNRWGNLIYSDDNYDNSWAGTNADGQELGDDTYYIVVDLGEEGTVSQAVAIKR